MNYSNGIQGFINYALSNPRNISGWGIRCPYKRYKNTKFFDPEFIEKYLCWYAYEKEPYVPHDTIVERMIGSTSKSSNVLGVVDDNSNSYRNTVIDAMRMNQGHVDQCLIVDEEPIADTTKVFDFFKDSNESL